MPAARSRRRSLDRTSLQPDRHADEWRGAARCCRPTGHGSRDGSRTVVGRRSPTTDLVEIDDVASGRRSSSSSRDCATTTQATLRELALRQARQDHANPGCNDFPATPFAMHNWQAHQMRWSPDGSMLVMVDLVDGYFGVWDTTDGHLIEASLARQRLDAVRLRRGLQRGLEAPGRLVHGAHRRRRQRPLERAGHDLDGRLAGRDDAGPAGRCGGSRDRRHRVGSARRWSACRACWASAIPGCTGSIRSPSPTCGHRVLRLHSTEMDGVALSPDGACDRDGCVRRLDPGLGRAGQARARARSFPGTRWSAWHS